MDEMKNDWTNMLSDYLDDALSEERRGALEDQLRQDAMLRDTLEELRAVKNLAGSLSDTEPTSDLWPGIASRIDVASDAAVVGDPAVVPLLPRRRESPSRFAFTAPQLAAAAVVMVLLGGTLTYVAQHGSAPGSTDGPEAGSIAAGPDTSNGMPTGLPVFAAATVKYEIAIHELEEGLAAGRSSLAPETVRVIEASLAKIDLA
ncbi:MAG: hypothetical protein V3U67_09290, partial [Gemmatimonadota bacterium]